MNRKAMIHWYESTRMNPSEGKIILLLLSNSMHQDHPPDLACSLNKRVGMP
jgi:hypothetical protein